MGRKTLEITRRKSVVDQSWVSSLEPQWIAISKSEMANGLIN